MPITPFTGGFNEEIARENITEEFAIATRRTLGGTAVPLLRAALGKQDVSEPLIISQEVFDAAVESVNRSIGFSFRLLGESGWTQENGAIKVQVDRVLKILANLTGPEKKRLIIDSAIEGIRRGLATPLTSNIILAEPSEP